MSTNNRIIHDFYSALDDSPIVMIGLPEQDAHSEPMRVHFDKGLPDKLFIYTRKDNRLVQGMRTFGDAAMLQFVSKGHDFFACIHAELSKVDDATLIDRFWSKGVDAWFDGGKSDPAMQMLQADLKEAEFWGADMSVGTVIKMALGMHIEPSEVEGQHAEVRL